MRHPAPVTARAVRIPAFAVCFALIIALATPWLAVGQEASEATPTSGETEISLDQPAAPPDESPPADTETPTETPPPSPEEPVTDSPVETPTTDSPPPSTPDAPAADSPSPPEETPPPPHLTYEIAPEMFCQPSEADAAGIIAAGATFDYDCAITTEIAAGQVLPGDITIDWLISAHSEGAWSIQVMSPWVDEGRWSEPGFQQEELAITSSGPESLATGVAGELAGTVTLPFGIRLFRPACDAALPFIQVEATVLASVPLNDAVVTERTSDQPAPLTLAPLLAAVPDIAPAVSIEYVAVDPVPFSLSEQTTNGSIAIRIDNPIVQCRSWTVQVSIATYAGSTPVGVTTVTAAGAIENATGDGFVQFAIDPALGLGPSASVSTVQPGAAPGSFTQTIDFVVILPGQLSAGVLTVQATASVVP